jgi:transcription antitermination factor NusG
MIAQIVNARLPDRIAPEPDKRTWFAVHTRARFEKRVASEFCAKEIEHFLPLLSVMHKWSDRSQLVHQPLFPGYVFVRLLASQDALITVLRTGGVMSFVGIRGIGTPIPEGEIQALQTVLQDRVPFQMHPFLNVGQFVRIRGGCLDGIEGILTAIHGKETLVISVRLIQKSIALQIRGYQVEPVRFATAGMITPPRELQPEEEICGSNSPSVFHS